MILFLWLSKIESERVDDLTLYFECQSVCLESVSNFEILQCFVTNTTKASDQDDLDIEERRRSKKKEIKYVGLSNKADNIA